MAHIMMSKLRYDAFDEGREEKPDPLIAGERTGTSFLATTRTRKAGRTGLRPPARATGESPKQSWQAAGLAGGQDQLLPARCALNR